MNQRIRAKCKNCGEHFWKLTATSTRGKLPVGVRGSRYVTCSDKCSKEYRNTRWMLRYKIKDDVTKGVEVEAS